MLASSPTARLVTEAAEPALSTLAQTLLGAFAVLCLIVAAVAIWQLIRVQNARATDQQAFREEYKLLVDQNSKLFDKMTSAVSGLKEAVAALTEQEKNSQAVITQLKSTMDSVHNTMQLLLMHSGRKHSPARGIPQQGGGHEVR